MPHDVIMPALGVAQDTGLILSWLKQSGDAIKIGDALMEIETDKAVMEVEAQADGYLTNISAAAGDHVPVGKVIALITESADSVNCATPGNPEPATTSTAPLASAAEAIPEDRPGSIPALGMTRDAGLNVQTVDADAPKHASSKRILASPKARRLASEQGLDLEHLARHGVPQPYHVADIETLKSLGNTTPLPDAPSQLMVHAESTQTVLRIDARVPAQGHMDFIEWMAQDKDICLPPHMAWLRYATGALRQATGQMTNSVIVEIRQAHIMQGCYADADQSRMSGTVTNSVDQLPNLILRDLSTSLITSITTAANVAPVLAIKKEGDDYVISLDYRAEHIDESVALNFITDFAHRLSEPLHHLL